MLFILDFKPRNDLTLVKKVTSGRQSTHAATRENGAIGRTYTQFGLRYCTRNRESLTAITVGVLGAVASGDKNVQTFIRLGLR